MYASYGASWSARGDHSPLTTPRQPLRSFYIAERAARAQAFFDYHCSCLRSRFASLFRDASRLCRRSASRLCRHSRLVSAGALLSLLSSLLALCLVFASVLLRSLLSTLLPSLLCFRLISPRLRLSLVAWPSILLNY